MKQAKYNEGFIIPLIIIIVALIGVGGGVAYYKHTKAKVAVDQSTTNSTDVKGDTNVQATTAQENSRGQTLRALLGLGISKMCTFSDTTSAGTNSGTVYISGKNMRMDGTMTSTAGVVTESHMIKADDTSYMWYTKDGKTQGVKMSMAMLDTTKTSVKTVAPTTPKPAVDLDAKVSYNCSNWSADNSKFTVPSNVTFIDMAAMMNNMNAQIKIKAGVHN